ncbi:MAG: alpha/beta hydrolase [bacterium]|nr:alpha/beta hydrolase [bacterium]
MLHEEYYEDGQVRLRYFRLGSGKPLLFLHGANLQAQTYKVLLESLAKKYLVIAPDLPGFGHSSVPKDLWGYEEYADYIARFISSLNLPEMIVVGHSLGGGIALQLATTSGKVSHLVIIDSAGQSITYSPRRLLYKVTLEKTAHNFTRYKNFKAFLTTTKDFFYNLFGKVHKLNHMTKMLNRLLTADLTGLERITAPTLILWGDEDEIFPPSVAEDFHRNIKNSKLQYIRGNHDWCIFRPEELSNLLTEWLEKP